MALDDKYTQSKADKINKTFKELKAPFFADCNKKGELVFYRISEGCNGKIHHKTSENALSNWLNKNANTTFKALFGRNPEKPKKRKKVEPKIIEKIVEKDCPPCPEVKCPEPEKVTNVKTLNITTNKAIDFDIKKEVKPKGKILKAENGLPALLLGDETLISTSSESIKSRYAIIELNNLVTSHNPTNFAVNPYYPKGCQEREYHSNQQLQINVIKRAKDFEPRFLINDAPTSEDGPPIIDRNGVVLGGNSRAMILILVSKNYKEKYQKYLTRLKRYKEIYGIEGFERLFDVPVLVRLIETGKSCSQNILQQGVATH